MAILAKQLFQDVMIPGHGKLQKTQELHVPTDFEAYGNAAKGLFEKIGTLIENDQKLAELPDDLRQALADHGIVPQLTDAERDVSYLVASMYVQNTDREGKPLENERGPYFFIKQPAFRESNGERFFPCTVSTVAMQEFKNGVNLTWDATLAQWVKDRLNKKPRRRSSSK